MGGYTLTANFTPTDTTDYGTATSSISYTVIKAMPTLNWSPAATSQVYGTAVGASVLNASVSGGVAGVISYTATPAGGQPTAITATTVIPAGSYSLTATFTPTDTADYRTAAVPTIYTVTQATPTITWPNPASITFGAALSSAQLNAIISVAGTFAYLPLSGAVLGVGPQTLSVTFTPTDTIDYKTVKAQVSLTVSGVSVSSLPPNSTVSSPVQLIALATPSPSSAKTRAMKIYVDNADKDSVNAASINTKLKLSRGAHHITVQAWDTLGGIYKNSFVITVR